jgi:hypothetical protein
MIAEIAEDEAGGEITRCYADIRARFGLPVVNLIWRHLAALGYLESSWASVRDRLPMLIAHAGEVNRAARRLAQACPLPPMPTPSPAAMDILAAYGRGNSLNLATVRILLGGDPASAESPPLEAAPARIPPVPRFSELPEPMRAIVERLAAAGPGADTGIRPTLWVHLALEPRYMSAIEDPVMSLLRHPSFRAAHVALSTLPSGGRAAMPEALGIALNRFNRRISEMLLVGLCLMQPRPPATENDR